MFNMPTQAFRDDLVPGTEAKIIDVAEIPSLCRKVARPTFKRLKQLENAELFIVEEMPQEKPAEITRVELKESPEDPGKFEEIIILLGHVGHVLKITGNGRPAISIEYKVYDGAFGVVSCQAELRCKPNGKPDTETASRSLGFRVESKNLSAREVANRSDKILEFVRRELRHEL